jgi:hypothetical protein
LTKGSRIYPAERWSLKKITNGRQTLEPTADVERRREVPGNPEVASGTLDSYKARVFVVVGKGLNEGALAPQPVMSVLLGTRLEGWSCHMP